ncbi:MAG: murein biosynthesis integral membrane protein MurJ [Acidobacteriota bacterium]
MEQNESTHSIFRTTAFVVGINLLSKILGMAREALVAGAFGAQQTTDAFFAAWRMPDVLFNSLLGVLIANTFIPVFYETMNAAGEDGARRFTRATSGAVLAALAVIACAYWMFAPQIMDVLAPGLDRPGNTLAVHMARILAPMVLLGGLTGVCRSLLHARRSFLAPAFLPVVLNVCVIVSVLTLGRSYGIETLAWGLVAASVLQAVMLLAALRRSAAMTVPALDPSAPGLGRMGSLILPILATFALGNVVPLVELHLASEVSTGAISYLSYAFRLFGLPEQIFMLAFSAILFPYLARDASRGEHGAMSAKLCAALRLSLYLMLPLGVYLAVFSREIVRLFLGWGAFDEAAVTGTGLTLAAYAWGLFAVCARNLLVDACFALKAPGLILKVAAAIIPLNILLDIALSRSMGAPGISLGFSLAAAAHCVVLFMALRPRLNGGEPEALLSALGRAALAAGAMGFLCWWARPWLVDAMPGHGFAWRVALLGLSATAAGAAYAVVQAALRCPEQNLLVQAIRSRRG